MRIANSMYYTNLFSPNKNKLSNGLYEVNKQISSGLKIEYARDDVSVFADTMRLDNEITTLSQAKESTAVALKMATQTDTTLNDFQTTLDRMKVLMVNAANATHNSESLDGIYQELKGLRNHLVNLSNTSINGQFIFSGSAVDQKPIDDAGNYHGNDKALKAFAGSQVQLQYNIPGSDLFLGEESGRHRKISTNIRNLNQTKLYPDVMQEGTAQAANATREYITVESTIRDLMGDIDNDPTNDPKSHFYVQGTKSDGTAFSTEITLDSDQKVSTLLESIANLYGKERVDVTLNEYGQIEIEDKIPGSSKLDFHMVGAVDFNLDGNNTDEATGKTLKQLQNANITLKAFQNSDYGAATRYLHSAASFNDPNDFSISGRFLIRSTSQNAQATTPLRDVVYPPTTNIHVSGTDTAGNTVNATLAVTSSTTMQDLVSFLDTAFDVDNSLEFSFQDGKIAFKSNNATASSNIDITLESQDGNANGIDGLPMDPFLAYDRVGFIKKDATLQGNVSQIVSKDNSYAIDSTKLSEVADLTQINANTLDGTSLQLNGVNRLGNVFDLTFNLASNGSSFTINKDTDGDGIKETSNTYSIFDAKTPRSAVDADEMTYRQLMDVINMALTDSLPASNTAADYDTAIQNANNIAQTVLDQKGQIVFKEQGVSSTKAEFSLYDNASPSVLRFMANDAITISDPKTDFFAKIDEAIESVRLNRFRADGEGNDPRNGGIQNGIQAIDDLSLHVTKIHSKIGALANSLDDASQRSEMLIVSTKTLRSDVLDTDIAEASMRLNQLTLNYQAMLSTVGRVSKLSLINYL